MMKFLWFTSIDTGRLAVRIGLVLFAGIGFHWRDKKLEIPIGTGRIRLIDIMLEFETPANRRIPPLEKVDHTDADRNGKAIIAVLFPVDLDIRRHADKSCVFRGQYTYFRSPMSGC